MIINLHRNTKDRITKVTLKKKKNKNKAGVLTFLDIKTYYKTAIIKKVWH